MNRIKLYAEQPSRRSRQVVGDLALVLWLVVAVVVGRAVHTRMLASAHGAQALQRGGTTFAGNMTDAGRILRKVPLIGDKIHEPFDKAAGAGHQIADAGRDVVAGLDDLGVLLGLLTAGLMIVTGLAIWGAARIPHIRRMSAAHRLRAQPAGARPLALQALAAGADATMAPEPVTDLLGDPAAVSMLADARLRGLGLRPIGEPKTAQPV